MGATDRAQLAELTSIRQLLGGQQVELPEVRSAPGSEELTKEIKGLRRDLRALPDKIAEALTRPDETEASAADADDGT